MIQRLWGGELLEKTDKLNKDAERHAIWLMCSHAIVIGEAPLLCSAGIRGSVPVRRCYRIDPKSEQHKEFDVELTGDIQYGGPRLVEAILTFPMTENERRTRANRTFVLPQDWSRDILDTTRDQVKEAVDAGQDASEPDQ